MPLYIIPDTVRGAIARLSVARRRVEDVSGEEGRDDALARRVLQSIATAETIRSNCRAAISSPSDVDQAEEAAMLDRAQRMLTRVLDGRRPRPPPSVAN